MRILRTASLAFAAFLCSAAAGQEVASLGEGQETGIQCFARLCNVRTNSVRQDRRRCHTCCAAHCSPNIVDCQDGCDRMKKWMDTDGEHDHNEAGELAAIYNSEPMFNSPELGDDAACVLVVGMLCSKTDTDIRLSLVTAGERLETCEMPADTRDMLECTIVEVAANTALCWKPRTTAVTVIGDGFNGDVLETAVLMGIICDPDSHAELYDRALEVLESL